MLVLTRKVGEGIAIGDDVKIIVMQIKGKQVRIGIKASPSTPVHREEIYQKIQEENRAAGGAQPQGVDAARGMLGGRTVRSQGGNLRVKGSKGADKPDKPDGNSNE